MSSVQASEGTAEGNGDTAPDNADTDTAYDVSVSNSNGQIVLHPEMLLYESLIKNLAADGYQMCVDLCGVDYYKNLTRELPNDVKAERFELVINFLDLLGKTKAVHQEKIDEAQSYIPRITELKTDLRNSSVRRSDYAKQVATIKR